MQTMNWQINLFRPVQNTSTTVLEISLGPKVISMQKIKIFVKVPPATSFASQSVLQTNFPIKVVPAHQIAWLLFLDRKIAPKVGQKMCVSTVLGQRSICVGKLRAVGRSENLEYSKL